MGGPENGKTANEIQFSFDFLNAFSKGKTKQNCFHHNLSKSARIEPSFCIVAKLEELNNLYLDCFESYRTKNASVEEIPGYLARARARARARPPAPGGWGASGPFREKRVNILPYARARPAREKKF